MNMLDEEGGGVVSTLPLAVGGSIILQLEGSASSTWWRQGGDTQHLHIVSQQL